MQLLLGRKVEMYGRSVCSGRCRRTEKVVIEIKRAELMLKGSGKVMRVRTALGVCEGTSFFGWGRLVVAVSYV